MYETFEHTADVGLRVQAPGLNGLFAEAAKGLFSLFVDNPETVRPLEAVRIEIDGEETDLLLFDWLNELLFLFETQQRLFCEFDVEFTDKGLTARARGETVDRSRHRLAYEVKAITYHQLEVKQTSDGWEARVIVDI